MSDLDNAYAERNRLVAALSRITGWPTWTATAPDAEGFSIVYIESPAGQLSWHVQDSEMEQFGPLLKGYVGASWDGHSTEEKYARLASL